jgi:hypothetical protein
LFTDVRGGVSAGIRSVRLEIPQIRGVFRKLAAAVRSYCRRIQETHICIVLYKSRRHRFLRKIHAAFCCAIAGPRAGCRRRGTSADLTWHTHSCVPRRVIPTPASAQMRTWLPPTIWTDRCAHGESGGCRTRLSGRVRDGRRRGGATPAAETSAASLPSPEGAGGNTSSGTCGFSRVC